MTADTMRSIVTTRRVAADPSIGPALVGVLWPRLVLPADFETRFDAQEPHSYSRTRISTASQAIRSSMPSSNSRAV